MRIKSLFYKIYFSVLAIAAILLAVGLIALNGWLKNYENAQPETIVNNIIENYLKSGNIYALKSDCNLDISKYETAENVNATIKAAINGKNITAASSALRPEGCDLSYAIKADDKKIINVFLKKQSGSSSINTTYEILSLSLADEFYKSAKIIMPEGTTVLVGGIPLASEDIKTAALPDIPEKYNPGNLSAPKYAEIKNLISDNISVSALFGDAPLVVNKSGNEYSVAQNINESTQSAIKTFAADASKAYSAYMQNDGSLSEIRKYISTDTEFYENLRTSLVIFSLDHQGYRFEDVETHEIFKYSDNLYSCRVTLTQVLLRNGAEYKDYFDKYVYIHINNNNMSVIDMQSSGVANE